MRAGIDVGADRNARDGVGKRPPCLGHDPARRMCKRELGQDVRSMPGLAVELSTDRLVRAGADAGAIENAPLDERGAALGPAQSPLGLRLRDQIRV